MIVAKRKENKLLSNRSSCWWTSAPLFGANCILIGESLSVEVEQILLKRLVPYSRQQRDHSILSRYLNNAIKYDQQFVFNP